jgi:hypothetical protein
MIEEKLFVSEGFDLLLAGRHDRIVGLYARDAPKIYGCRPPCVDEDLDILVTSTVVEQSLNYGLLQLRERCLRLFLRHSLTLPCARGARY